MTRNRRRARRTSAVLCLLVLSASGTALAATVEELKPASEALAVNLLPIRAQMQNMRSKAQRGVVGIADPPQSMQGAPEVTGWAAQCCVDNVIRLHLRLNGFEETAKTLDRLYRSESNGQAVNIVSKMLADVNALREGLAVFAAAPDQATTNAVVQSMIRLVAGINRHHGELSECCDHVEIVVEIPAR